ncbi:MAG: MFS transporter [Patescibacteria group bacterium]|nr:MFS transporter [Actinomycetota bacterium]MCL5438501.1 MFS transporter [Patescibacteria group bacterium]
MRNIKILTWFNFFTDFKLYAPVAIIYFSRVSGSFALGMSIFSIATISAASFEVPTGVFSDYIGRRKTVIWGALCAVIYSIFYAIGGSYVFLAAGAIFDGISVSFYSGNNDALLYDSLSQHREDHRYAEYLGKLSSMFQIALAVSALIGAFIANWSFAWVMWISVIPQLVCLILSFFLVEPENISKRSGNIYNHLKEAFSLFITNKKLRLLSLSSIILSGVGEASYQFQAAFYSMLWPIWAIGFAKALSNIGATVGFRFSGNIIKRFGAIKTLVGANIYSRVLNMIAVIYPTFLSPLLMSLTSPSYGVVSIARTSLMQKEFRNEQRATMGSLNSFFGSIFFAVVSFMMGFIADKISPAMALLLFQILLLPTIWLNWLIFKHDRKDTS